MAWGIECDEPVILSTHNGTIKVHKIIDGITQDIIYVTIGSNENAPTGITVVQNEQSR